ncbi:MAG: lipid-binding SYLF domain-containing protein [Verrucomicrobiota bacterium]
MKKILTLLLAVCPLLLQAETQADKDLARVKEIISQADDILLENQNTPEAAVPKELFAEAEAVLVVRLESAIIGVGGYGGTGIAMINNIDNWSPPAVYSISGGQLGLEIGGTETDIIALYMNKKALRSLYDDSIRWGVGLSVQAGPAGGRLAATEWRNADILVYRKKKGLALGVSFTGGVLEFNQSLNAALYQEPNIDQSDIFGLRVPMPAEGKEVTDYLRKLSFEGTDLSKPTE